MADPIDNDFFERDIKPLRDTYGLNRRESNYITSLEDRDMQPHLRTMLQLRSQLVQERNSDLAYQTGLFEFEEKKKKAREEIDYAERTAQATKDIGEIVDNDARDVYQKQADLAKYATANALLFNKSPTAGLVLRSSENFIKAQAAQKASADKDGESLSRLATAGVSPEEFGKAINADGVVTPQEENLARVNDANYAQSKATQDYRGAQGAAASRKAVKDEGKASLDAGLARLNEDETFIRDIEKVILSYQPPSVTNEEDVTYAKEGYAEDLLNKYFPEKSYGTVLDALQDLRAQRKELRSKNTTLIATNAEDENAGNSMRQ